MPKWGLAFRLKSNCDYETAVMLYICLYVLAHIKLFLEILERKVTCHLNRMLDKRGHLLVSLGGQASPQKWFFW
jgi:hypothetical protein